MFDNLSKKLDKAFQLLKGQGQITEINVAETLKEVRRALLEADVNFKTAKDFTNKIKEKAKVDEWSYFCAMELDALSIYILRRHEQVENRGLSNLYGEAPNAIKTAKEHFARMMKACERDVPNEKWLMGNSPSCADIMFISCLQVAKLFKIQIESDKIVSYLERSVKRKQLINAESQTFGEQLLTEL